MLDGCETTKGSEVPADGFRDHDGRDVRRRRDDVRHDRRVDDVQAIRSTYRALRIDDGARVGAAAHRNGRGRVGVSVDRRYYRLLQRVVILYLLPGVISSSTISLNGAVLPIPREKRTASIIRLQVASILEEVEADERHSARVAARQAD